MKNLILVIFAMTVSTAKAQIFSAGVFRNQILKSEIGNVSSQGIELASTHYFISVNAGLGWGKTENRSQRLSYVGADFTPTGFHHAYLANKFAPFVGFQVSVNKLNLKKMDLAEFPQNPAVKNVQYTVNLGFKYSNGRFIGSAAYKAGQNENAVVVKMAYVIGVTHKCLKKRLQPIQMGF